MYRRLSSAVTGPTEDRQTDKGDSNCGGDCCSRGDNNR